MRAVKWMVCGSLLLSSVAFAGRGGSTGKIKNAIASGSTDAIVAELERAEVLSCTSCVAPVRTLIDSDSQKVRDAAGWWLARHARSEVMPEMIARLAAQDPVAARNAADVLAPMRDVRALPALTAYLAKPLDEASGMAAARAVGTIGHPAALASLESAMKSPLAGVRNAAARALRDLRAPEGAKVVSGAANVVVLLSDSDATVRREAAYTCGHLGDKSAVGKLSEVVKSDSDPLVRKAAAWALGEIGSTDASTALTQAKADADPLVRSIATAALGRLH